MSGGGIMCDRVALVGSRGEYRVHLIPHRDELAHLDIDTPTEPDFSRAKAYALDLAAKFSCLVFDLTDQRPAGVLAYRPDAVATPIGGRA